MVDYDKLAQNRREAEDEKVRSVEQRNLALASFFRQLDLKLRQEVQEANVALKKAQLPLITKIRADLDGPFINPQYPSLGIVLVREDAKFEVVRLNKCLMIDLFISSMYTDPYEGGAIGALWFKFKPDYQSLHSWHTFRQEGKLAHAGPKRLAEIIVSAIIHGRDQITSGELQIE
jgi:hypothetical protein